MTTRKGQGISHSQINKADCAQWGTESKQLRKSWNFENMEYKEIQKKNHNAPYLEYCRK